MERTKYKFIIAFVFSIFGSLSSFYKTELSVIETLQTEQFWFKFLMYFVIGFVILGNIVWYLYKKNKNK